MVIDSSALLAIIFEETHGQWVAERLSGSSTPLVMSTVNYAEMLIIVRERQPTLAAAVEQAIAEKAISLVAPDVSQADVAAVARLQFPLNLRDCFAYALAVSTGYSIVTLDRDFRNCDVDVELPAG